MNELDLRGNFKTLYIKRVSISLLFLIIVLALMPLNEIRNDNGRYTEGYNFISPCEDNIFYAISSYNQLGIDYEVIVDYSLDIFPNIKNLKCLNKINTIEKFDNFYEIKTSRNQQLEKLILILFLFFLLIFNNLRLVKYSILLFFTFINFSYYNFSSINLAFILNLSLIILVVLCETPPLKEKKIFQIPLIFLVFMTHFYNFFRFRSSDEIYYIGLNFRSSSNFSSYFQQDFMEGFNNLILFFVNIFEDNFFIAIKVFHFLFFCYVILGFKDILKLSNYSIILFVLLLFRFQGIFSTHWLFFNFTPAGICNLLILTAFIQFFKSRYVLVVITLVIATYIHFAYVLLLSPLFIYLSLNKLEIKKVLNYGLLYFILSVSNIGKIYASLAESSTTDVMGELRYYIAIRHAQNLPFDLSYGSYLKPLLPIFIKGFVYMFIGLIIMIIIKKFQIKIDKFYIDFVLFSYFIFFSYMIILNFFPISYFALPVPLRLSVYVIFFSLLIIIKTLELTTLNYGKSRKSETFFLVFMLIYLTPFTWDLYNPIKSISTQNSLSMNYVYEGIEENDLVNKINEYENSSIFISVPATISGTDRDFFDTLELSTQNPAYAVFKFVPHQINLMKEWRERIKNSEAFFLEDCDALDEIKPFYYILSKADPLINNCGELEYENQKYQIYIYK